MSRENCNFIMRTDGIYPTNWIDSETKHDCSFDRLDTENQLSGFFRQLFHR